MVFGVDYGSRLAGTTAICYREGDAYVFCQSAKKQDADKFLQDFFSTYDNGLVAIDAPLSLPKVYGQPDRFSDYHYRKCDREVAAMSPMFLGGLTARAMSLANTLRNTMEVVEVYPKLLSMKLNLPQGEYKKDPSSIERLTETVTRESGVTMKKPPQNWHQFDALLACLSGERVRNGTAQAYGDPEEGLIYC